jgi:hypothetical protein
MDMKMTRRMQLVEISARGQKAVKILDIFLTALRPEGLL